MVPSVSPVGLAEEAWSLEDSALASARTPVVAILANLEKRPVGTLRSSAIASLP